MNETAQLRANIEVLNESTAQQVKLELIEGRVFNNTGELLRSLLNDIKRIHTAIHDGMSALEDVEEDLNDVVHYYMDAEIKQQRY